MLRNPDDDNSGNSHNNLSRHLRNQVRRFVAPPGDLTICRDAVIEDSGRPDPVKLDAEEIAVERLPNDTLIFLLGSRYCETDKLSEIAWRSFGSTPRGWRRVQAICDFVCNHLTFGYQYASATRTAYEAYQERRGSAVTSPTSPLLSAAA